MCNKVATPDSDELQGYFDRQDVNQGHVFKVEDAFDRYFHADGFTMPHLPFTASDTPHSVKLAMWKLIPPWVKDWETAKKSANTLNARSEDIFKTASYKNFIGRNRGLLWVNGIYEPNHPKPKVTIPYYIRAVNNEPFSLGCVYSDWVNQETGEVTRTFSIITTPANELLSRIHNEGLRMPYIVTPENRKQWLGPLDEATITDMMKPLPEGLLHGYPVSGLVYKRGVDSNVPEAMQEIALQAPAPDTLF